MNTIWSNSKLFLGLAILLVISGAVHRWTRGRRVLAFRPLAAPLSDIPPSLDTYNASRDLPMSAEILDVSGVDEFVHREYSDVETGRSIEMYIGYWGYENLGMGHGPDVCYPATGWQNDESPTTRTLSVLGRAGDSPKPVMALHRFFRTRPEGIERRAVGFIAVVDGRYCPSSRGTFLHRPSQSRRTGFLAHILVSTLVSDTDWESAELRIEGFMRELLPHAGECLFGADPDSNLATAPPDEVGSNVQATYGVTT